MTNNDDNKLCLHSKNKEWQNRRVCVKQQEESCHSERSHEVASEESILKRRLSQRDGFVIRYAQSDNNDFLYISIPLEESSDEVRFCIIF
jgi:hypothetical protein